MNSYDFFIYEFICFMNTYINSGVPRFQITFPALVVESTWCLPYQCKASRAASVKGPPGSCPPMLGRFVQVYCDGVLVFSKAHEEHPVKCAFFIGGGVRDWASEGSELSGGGGIRGERWRRPPTRLSWAAPRRASGEALGPCPAGASRH